MEVLQLKFKISCFGKFLFTLPFKEGFYSIIVYKLEKLLRFWS